MRPNSAYKKSGTQFHYYSCRYNTGPNRDCGNRKYLRADQIEERVWGSCADCCGTPRDAEFWSKK